MNQTYVKKLIASSIALSLVLGGSTLYTARHIAHAEGSEATQQTTEQHTAKMRSHNKRWPIVEEAASLLGMDKEALEKELKSGKSIIDVAAQKGISEADLTAKLQALRSGKIDEAAKDGKLSADQAEHMKQRLSDHLKFILNEKNLFEKMDHRGRGHKHGFMPNTGKLAKELGMSSEELRTELKAGKSLAEIAKSKGISKDKLVETIKDQLTPSIEKMVEHKKNADKTE